MYGINGYIPLHEPKFVGKEKQYLNECIDSTFVSYLGEFVEQFENMVQEFTGAKHAIAMANGTLALHIALKSTGVKENDEVLTQAITFVATANAISYCRAKPVFIDSEKKTLGMSPEKLEEFLEKETVMYDDAYCYNRKTGKKISACVPMHVFGHPVRVDRILDLCSKRNILVIEDSAESLGSFYRNKHTGTFGRIGIFSFNGNKIITTGGGGMIITDNDEIAKIIRHVTTTAKMQHKWEYFHDEIGYNYRMPNINAALGCAQMENLPLFLKNKRLVANLYKDFFDSVGFQLFTEPAECISNYWLNAIILNDRIQRDEFLEYAHNNGVMARPVWTLMNRLPMYNECQTSNLDDAQWLEDRIINLPSSVRL